MKSHVQNISYKDLERSHIMFTTLEVSSNPIMIYKHYYTAYWTQWSPLVCLPKFGLCHRSHHSLPKCQIHQSCHSHKCIPNRLIYYSSSYYTHFSLFTVQLSLLLKILSYPGNLAKSNSEDLWTSLVSSPELHSNKSLCQESDILLIH